MTFEHVGYFDMEPMGFGLSAHSYYPIPLYLFTPSFCPSFWSLVTLIQSISPYPDLWVMIRSKLSVSQSPFLSSLTPPARSSLPQFFSSSFPLNLSPLSPLISVL